MYDKRRGGTRKKKRKEKKKKKGRKRKRVRRDNSIFSNFNNAKFGNLIIYQRIFIDPKF